MIFKKALILASIVFCLSEPFLLMSDEVTQEKTSQANDQSNSPSNTKIETENKTTGTPKGKPEKKEKDTGDKIEAEPPKVGNFSLPASQQPAALFGFGGNIIDKGEIQIYLFADEFVGRKRLITDVIPSVLFGVTDNFSVFFNFPFTPILRDGDNRSSGLEDFFIQLEYAFYNKKTWWYVDQATLVFNVTAPTGSVKKKPNTGFGAPSVFLGGTYYRTMVDWFFFTAPGAVLTMSNHGTKIGDQFLYQFGFGRNIPSPCGWIYAWMIELDGQYSRKNRIKGEIDPNSGGNIFYITPSLWFSNKDFLIQFGVSIPAAQNLFGKQNRIDYGFNFNVAWSFY